MKKLLRRMRRIVRRDDGASAVEYGLLVALIAVIIAGTVAILGTTLKQKFTDACEEVGGTGCSGQQSPAPPGGG